MPTPRRTRTTATLAAGPRKSEYFLRLFKDGGRFAGSSSSTSCINLSSKLEAAVFPALLDYIYSVDHKLEICRETATALHHLGGCFEMRRLRWDAKQFIEKKMSASSCGTFYEHAKILNKQNILDAAANAAASLIQEISMHSRLLHVLDGSGSTFSRTQRSMILSAIT
jgi:hypothetical protein